VRKVTGTASLGFLLLVLLGFSVSAHATPAQDTAVGSIQWCLSNKADGDSVTLTYQAVMWRGMSGRSFAIKEWTDKWPKSRPQILIVSTRPLPVEPWWTVEVTGTLQTLRTASVEQRVVITSPSQVFVYCNDKGIPAPVIFRGWDWPGITKRSLAELAPQTTTMMTLDESPLPPADDPLADSPPDTRTGLKYLPDGALVHLQDRVVSATYYGFFYIEEPDRSSAIRVDAEYAYPSVGDLVEISGVLTTNGGERAILVEAKDPMHFVNVIDSGCPVPRPLGMPNKSIGGGPAGLYAPGIGSSVGLNNTGMLVTAWGRVTTDVNYGPDGTPYYYIDDGANLQGEPGYTGIKVYDYSRWPTIGDYLTLTGVASSEFVIGTATSIACLRATDYTPPASGIGAGTLSGLVMADASAAGKVVRIYGTGGSTTCTLDGNGSGSYTIPNVRAGDHTFSADLLGYTRDTAKVTVTNGQTTTHNFTLTAAQARLIISAAPSTITACTGDPSTVTVFVYHESGTACANSIVTLETDLGQFAESAHIQEIQTTTNASGLATVQLWQGNDPPGIAHLTVNATSPTTSGSLDVPIVCPVPKSLFATGVGSGKIAIYWDVCPNSTGYEVYRGTVSGGNKDLLTGTPQPAFENSSRMVFIDQTAVDDTTYYYSVKAVYSCGVSEASDEVDALTNSAAIPWDTRDSASIVTAALVRSPEPISCPVDVIGPDGTVYSTGRSPVLPPVAGPPGPEPADVSLGSQMMAAGTENEPNNAHSGPYRKIESYPGYRKETAYAVLPAAGNIKVTPATYPPGSQRRKKGKLVPCTNSGDIPYMYLGSLGSHNEHVDAGLRYEPSDGKWNLFFLIGPTRTFWVFDPNMPEGADPQEYPTPPTGNPWLEFNCGSPVLLEYWCGKDKNPQNKRMKNGVWLRGTGTTGQRAVFAEVNGHPEGGSGVAMKRVSSIGQYLPVNYPRGTTQYDLGYQKSGSYFLEGEWTGVQVYDQTRAWYVDADHARFKQEFPVSDANVVTFHMEAPYYWENHINIDLR
jgi:hypothetical protein